MQGGEVGEGAVAGRDDAGVEDETADGEEHVEVEEGRDLFPACWKWWLANEGGS